MKNTARENYVGGYYRLYADGEVDIEIRTVGEFLARNVKGITLDCGCGPTPQLWAICMPFASQIRAIDVIPESITFVKRQLRHAKEWIPKFSGYAAITEKVAGPLTKNYIGAQIRKLKSVKCADMTKRIPFPDKTFDTVMSLYSLGVLSSEAALSSALGEIARVLKPGGTLLHVNTNGRNRNEIIPEYTWQGLPQTINSLTRLLSKHGLHKNFTKNIALKKSAHELYRYNGLQFLSATKT